MYVRTREAGLEQVRSPYVSSSSPFGSQAGGAGIGQARPRQLQVTSRFMTHRAKDPFRYGAITMLVFDGRTRKLLWKPGTLRQGVLTYLDAVNSNEIHSPVLSGVTGDNVIVELKVKMLELEHKLDHRIPVVTFGTAASFDVSSSNKLRVIVDVDTAERDFVVNARDANYAEGEARRQLKSFEEIHLSTTKSVTQVKPGRFRVVLWTFTKRILILTPKTLRTIYP